MHCLLYFTRKTLNNNFNHQYFLTFYYLQQMIDLELSISVVYLFPQFFSCVAESKHVSFQTISQLGDHLSFASKKYRNRKMKVYINIYSLTAFFFCCCCCTEYVFWTDDSDVGWRVLYILYCMSTRLLSDWITF